MEYLSISIDTVNSTEIKTIINSISKDIAVKNQKTEEFFNYMIDCEKVFYSKLNSKKLLDKTFLVKSIGDELWYVVDLMDFKNDISKQQAIKDIIKILQEIIRNFRILNIPERILTIHEKLDIESCKKLIKDTRYLTRKITVDLIEDAYDFTIKRQQFLREQYRTMLYHDIDSQETDKHDILSKKYRENIIDISHNLGLGSTIIDEENNIERFESARIDLIGRDVDRFFRITKEAKPGLLMVGDLLFSKYLKYQNKRTKNTNDDIHFSIEFPNSEKVIPTHDLKGILEDYTVHYLPSKFHTEILTNHNSIFTDAKNILINSGFIINSSRWNEQKWLD